MFFYDVSGTVKSRIAYRSRIERSMTTRILNGDRKATPAQAKALAAACERLGIQLTRWDFLYPEESDNPRVRPVSELKKQSRRGRKPAPLAEKLI